MKPTEVVASNRNLTARTLRLEVEQRGAGSFLHVPSCGRRWRLRSGLFVYRAYGIGIAAQRSLDCRPL